MLTKAVILARAPVALLPIANKPLIAHTLCGLARAGVRRMAIVSDPSVRAALEGSLEAGLPDQCTVQWTDDVDEEGLPCRLSRLEEFVGSGPFVLHLGDSLARKSLGSLLRTAPEPLHISMFVQEHSGDDRLVELAPRRLAAGSRGCNGSGAISAGAWVLGEGVLAAAARVPALGSWELEIPKVIERLGEVGGRVTLHHVDDWWRYRRCPEALLEGNRFALQGLEGSPVEAQLLNTRIQGAVSIDPTARLESSIIRGPAVIGARVRLRDAYVGPYTSIGDDAVIEGAEIEHSIILPRATISHVGGRLEASVVGSGAKVFRDFSLPRALRLNVGEGAEVSLA